MSDAELGDRSSLFTAQSVPDAYERYVAAPLFAPWAELLLDHVGSLAGARVLDVASGTGVAARAAAQRAGAAGSLVATDVSEAMLARSAAAVVPEGSAPIVFAQAPADALPFADGSFDAVLCQQGLQFFPDQPRSVAEMRRVLRDGGAVGIAVWADGHPLVPFGVYCEELVAVDAEPPFPRAFDIGSYTMRVDSLRALLTGAGFSNIEVAVQELEVSWPDAAAAAAGVLATPYTPSLDGLTPERRAAYDAAVLERFTPEQPGAPVRRQTAAVIARATA
jgi:ubiquinone/menaquinone biosynthesis C-methylase UbiE